MKSIFALIVSLILMAPAPAGAADQATTIKVARGRLHTMCNAETSTGVCDYNLTNDRYAIVEEYDSITFFLTEVGAATSDCDIYAVDESISLSAADISGLQANQINSTALSGAQDKIGFSDIDFYAVWITCTAIGGTSTTVTMQGSVGRSRL